jgi:DNA-binding PadR family transcriptional regulator
MIPHLGADARVRDRALDPADHRRRAHHSGGALYPALHRLQRKGWLDEEWGLSETNREAKYYRLTPAGRRQLRAEIARWQAYARAVTAALDASPA